MNHVIITKFVAYISVYVADVEKVFKGLQSNPLVVGFLKDLMKYMDFEIKLPFKPVSLKVNITRQLSIFS